MVAPDRAGRDLLLDSIGPGTLGSPPHNIPPELTCISEEGGLDLDLDLDIPEHLLEDLDCGGDCITSCNKVSSTFHLVPSIYLRESKDKQAKKYLPNSCHA